jgi:hypothetical protein
MVASRITEDEVPQISRSRWADNFFRPLLIAIMIMCINMALVNLVRLINPSWRGTYFLIGMLLTTVEGIYSYRILKLVRSRGISLLRYRLAEWAVLILILKILNFADKPLSAVWLELQALWQNPANFINLEFYIVLLLAFTAWGAATSTMADFEELHDPYTFRSDNVLPLDDLARRFFWGGIFLVVISGVTQWGLRAGLASLIDFRRPTLSGVIFNVLVYFTVGLMLLSQAHLTTLMMRWRIQKITVASNLVRQWAKYGFLFLGFITFVVFLLPTGYTLGFLTSAAIVIQYLLGLLAFLVELLLFLISLPLLWLLSLLGQSPNNVGSAPLAPPPIWPGGSAGGQPVSWLEALRSLIFWLLAMAIAWYLIKIYLNDHPELLDALKRFKPTAFLIKLLTQLWNWLTGLAQAGLELLPKKVAPSPQASGRGKAARWRWLGLKNGSPRQQIIYYYLNTLQRARQAGRSRQAHETPYEYEPNLSQTIPKARSAVDLLTQAFIHARYSRGPFHQAQAALARQFWQQIRRELKRAKKEKDVESEE